VTFASLYEGLKGAVALDNRRWLGYTYKDCANATDMVDYLVLQPCCSEKPDPRGSAVEICRELQKQNAISHVWSTNPRFRDAKMYFRFSTAGADGEAAVANSNSSYDVVVIGGGSAGIAATLTARNFGARCLMLEGHKVGGDCTWSGCVPSKSLIKASHSVHAAAEASQLFGVKGVAEPPKADLAKVMDYVQQKIDIVAKHDLETLENNQVPLRHGHAVFTGSHTIKLTAQDAGVEAETITSRVFILCLGAKPSAPPISGLDSVSHYTYETIFGMRVAPRQLCVIGGGVIGCEMAQAFARLGVQVTLVASRLLPKEPEKVDRLLAEQFTADGITLVRGRATAVTQDAGGGAVRVVSVDCADKTSAIVECDALLVAAGRRPNTESAGLAAAGVEIDPRTALITVNKTLQTTASHIYAAGDCCTPQQFTHYASLMGGWAVRNALLPGNTTPTDVVPRCTFTTPEVASVGLTEEEARERGFQVYSQDGSKNERAICESDTRGFIDVYLDGKGRVMGATVMNNRAGELLSELTVAMENRIPFADLGLHKVVHPYPSYSWSMSMLASAVYNDRFAKSTSAKIAKFIVRAM